MTFHETFAKLHRTYERKALRMLLKEFQALGKKIPYELLTPENAEGLIRLTLNEAGLEKALFKIHLTIGKSYGNLEARRYRKFREEKRFKPLPLFNEAFQQYILDFYTREGGDRIVILTDTYIEEVVKVMKIATENNETIAQMRDRIFKTVNKPNFYKWQALRIARTETTFAMNSAAMVSSDVSGLVMEKVWYTYRDSRVRDTHAEMEGKVVPSDEYFELSSGVKLKFPGDKQAEGRLKDVKRALINCRCSVSHRAKLDENGLFIFTDEPPSATAIPVLA